MKRLILAAIAAAGLTVACEKCPTQPVCHSASEDGVITDCDFRDGGWYQK